MLAYCQNYFVLEHRKKIKEVAITEGDLVVIISKDGEKVRGKIKMVNHNLVQVKNKVIPLCKIEGIGTKNKFVSSLGSLLVTNGMNLLIYGLNENFSKGWKQVSALHKASLPMLAAGLPVFLITQKRTTEKWKFHVVMDRF